MNTRKCHICGKTIQIQKKRTITSQQAIQYHKRWFCKKCWKQCLPQNES